MIKRQVDSYGDTGWYLVSTGERVTHADIGSMRFFHKDWTPITGEIVSKLMWHKTPTKENVWPMGTADHFYVFNAALEGEYITYQKEDEEPV